MPWIPTEPEQGGGGIVLGTVDSFIMSRFGGPSIIEAGNASRTQLLDIDAVAWSPPNCSTSSMCLRRHCRRRCRTPTASFQESPGWLPLPDGVSAPRGDGGFACRSVRPWRPSIPARSRLRRAPAPPPSWGWSRPEHLSTRGLCRTIAWARGSPRSTRPRANIRAAGATPALGRGFARGRRSTSSRRWREAPIARVSALVPGFNGPRRPRGGDDRGHRTAEQTSTLGTSRGAVGQGGSRQYRAPDRRRRRCHRTAVRRPSSHLFVDGGPTRKRPADATRGGPHRPADLARSGGRTLGARRDPSRRPSRRGVWTEAQLADAATAARPLHAEARPRTSVGARAGSMADGGGTGLACAGPPGTMRQKTT